jgi:hypothetical protein
LKPKCDVPLSNFAFNFNLRRYTKVAPADYPYLHNDIHLRDGPDGWPAGAYTRSR